MGKMTKLYAGINDFVANIADREKISRKEADRLLRMFLEVFEEELTRPEKDGVQFVDFITIEKMMRKEKLARNPRKPDKEIIIPSRIGFKVNVGKKFAKKLGY